MPQGWDWVIIAIVFLLLFGAAKLPQMARSLGQSARIFKSEMKGMREDDEARARDQQAAPQQQALPASNQAAGPGTQTAPNAQAADGAGSPDTPR